jgi:hypothetical protein
MAQPQIPNKELTPDLPILFLQPTFALPFSLALTLIPGIRPHYRTGRNSRQRRHRVSVTGIADKDCLFLYFMAALAICGARVDGVLEVEAFADGIALDNPVAHLAGYDVVSAPVVLEVGFR